MMPETSADLPVPVDPERALLALARSGDFAAFESLVALHERRIYAIGMRIAGPRDAEDVVQTTFLAALEHLDQLRPDASFGAWLARIATNAGLKVLRGRRARGEVSFEASGGDDDDGAPLPHPALIAPWRDDPERLVERAELRRILDDAIDALPEKHRAVFALREVAGLSVEETAQALEISAANVKVRHLRARLALRERLTARFGDETRRVTVRHAGEETRR